MRQPSGVATVRSVPDQSQARALARQRHDVILTEVRRRGTVRVTELATLLGVSDMTVRRDLDVLDASGAIVKVHGGATVSRDLTTNEPGFLVKSQLLLEEKHLIARTAATLIRPGAAIGVTAGTTTWRLAALLVDIPELTVVTNSVRVADVLHEAGRRDHTVVLTGGVRTPSDALVGPVATTSLRGLQLDMVFMGVHGVSERRGFSTPNLMEAETNRAFVDAAERLVVLADHTKWNVTGLSSIAPLDAAEWLITDSQMPVPARSVLDAAIPTVVYTEVSGTDSISQRRA